MLHLTAPVAYIRNAGKNIFVMAFRSPELAAVVKPAQFINIKVHDFYQPLLRRPFSVYRVEGEVVEIIFNAIGAGTKILASKRVGDLIDIIGPLGHPFQLEGSFDTALLVGGGLGVAPLPMAAAALAGKKETVTFLGARSIDQIVSDHLPNVFLATDDGSSGFKGTVVDLLREKVKQEKYSRPKIFSCGPNVMLKALAAAADEMGIPCEVSLESAMACGIGLCQGCPIEVTNGPKKYALVCKDGTVFDTKGIRFA